MAQRNSCLEPRVEDVDLKMYQREREKEKREGAPGQSLGETEKMNLQESTPYYCITYTGSPSGRDLLHNYLRRYSDSLQNKGPQMES